MKKLLSLILAIVMIASIAAMSVSAAEVKAGNKNDNMTVNDGVYEAATDNWGCYILGETDNFECSMTLKNAEAGDPEYGLNICGKDGDGDGLLLEGADSYLSIFVGPGNQQVQLIGCDKGWGNVSGYQWANKTTASGKASVSEFKLTVKLQGKHLELDVDDAKIAEYDLDDSVCFGNIVALSVKHPGDTISNVVFTDNNKKTDDKKDDVKPDTDTKKITTTTVAGATDGNASWAGNDKEFKVTKEYFAVSYTMKASTKAGVAGDNGCCGLTFGDGDDNNDNNAAIFIPYDGSDGTNRLLGHTADGAQCPVVRCGPWWATSPYGNCSSGTDISTLADKDVTILVLGHVKDGKATMTAYVNGEQIKVWGDQDEATGAFNGDIGWAIRLNNTEATLKFTESDKPLDKFVFDESETPVAPKTGEAGAFVALVSVFALAGVVIASKKRI